VVAVAHLRATAQEYLLHGLKDYKETLNAAGLVPSGWLEEYEAEASSEELNQDYGTVGAGGH